MRTDLPTIGLAALFLAGCPGKLDEAQQFLRGCSDVPGEMLAKRCATVGCHGGEYAAQSLDLANDPLLTARLVGVPATGCDGLLIDTAHPEQSVLFRKLTDIPPCGDKMPVLGEPLSSDELACVYSWITSFADKGAGGAAGSGGSVPSYGGGTGYGKVE